MQRYDVVWFSPRIDRALDIIAVLVLAALLMLSGWLLGGMLFWETPAPSLVKTNTYADLQGAPIPGGFCLFSRGNEPLYCMYNDESGVVIMPHTEPGCTARYCVEHNALGQWLVVLGQGKWSEEKP